ncbi:MAG: thiamine pyrophosphate-requiring protein, partial [Gammaproteobacteria bacterium]
MADTVGDFILQRLSEWKVGRIFGYPGDGINGLMGAMGRATDRFEYVRVRHEEMAAFMAAAHAKLTGEIGVCMATSGPGALHLLAGLYDAKMDHAPVLAIVGQQASASLGSEFQQEVELEAVFDDVGDYVQTIVAPAQARHVVDRAMRIAAAERSVSVIIVPNDVQMQDAVPSPPRAHGTNFSSVGHAIAHPWPDDAALHAAADVLNAGERVAMLVGAGALHATDELITVAETLGAGVAKSLLGKAAVPDDLPFVTGVLGPLGTNAGWNMMQGCDTLLTIGSTFPYPGFLPAHGQARAVQIDRSARNLELRHPAEVSLLGDAAETLRRLLPLLERKQTRDWRAAVEAGVAQWWRDVEAHARMPATPVNPESAFWALSSRLPDNSIVCGDCGTHTGWYARDVRLRRGMMGSLSGKLASMGSGIPYAIAAKMAYPDRPVLALVGDGAMQMNGNAELITVKQYWRRWRSPQFVVMVLVNRDLNQTRWEQQALTGSNGELAPMHALADLSYAAYAELLGFKGIRVDDEQR